MEESLTQMLRNSGGRPIPSVVLCARIDRWIARGLCSEVQTYRGNLQALGRYEAHANDINVPRIGNAGYDLETWNGNFRYQWDAPISTQDLVEYYAPRSKVARGTPTLAPSCARIVSL